MSSTQCFSSAERVLGLIDLAGYARLFSTHDEQVIAGFLDEWYGACHEAIEAAGGRVVKFIGDACLAVFPREGGPTAVECLRGLRASLGALAARHGLALDSGANLHRAAVIEGRFGPAGRQHEDVLGSGVNHVFLMGRGPGLRISEPVYRSLPADRRSVWRKHKPPAVYHER